VISEIAFCYRFTLLTMQCNVVEKGQRQQQAIPFSSGKRFREVIPMSSNGGRNRNQPHMRSPITAQRFFRFLTTPCFSSIRYRCYQYQHVQQCYSQGSNAQRLSAKLHSISFILPGEIVGLLEGLDFHQCTRWCTVAYPMLGPSCIRRLFWCDSTSIIVD